MKLGPSVASPQAWRMLHVREGWGLKSSCLMYSTVRQCGPIARSQLRHTWRLYASKHISSVRTKTNPLKKHVCVAEWLTCGPHLTRLHPLQSFWSTSSGKTGYSGALP